MTQGRKNAKKAMQRVAANTDPAWVAFATDRILSLAAVKPEFTMDDFWATEVPPVHHKRALGPVVYRLSRLGAIEWTGRVVATGNPKAHAMPIRVWRKGAGA